MPDSAMPSPQPAAHHPAAAPPLPRLLRLVRWPLILTVILLTVRLVGEHLNWDPRFFPREGGPSLSPVGVWVLIPIVGFVLGFIITGTGHAPDRPGLALILHLLGATLLVAAVTIGMKTLTWPMLPIAPAIGALIAMAFAWRAWPELIRYTFTYGLLTRLLVVAVTAPAVWFGWGTHLEFVPPEFATDVKLDRFLLLASTQLLIWVPATVTLGGAAASLASLLRGRRADDAQDE